MPPLQRLRRLVGDFAEYRNLQRRREAGEERLLRHLGTRRAAFESRRPTGTPSSDGRNLILGLSAGYNEDDLAPFVLSLRRGGFVGDVVLFVSDTTPSTLAFLERHGIATVPFLTLPLFQMSMNSARMLRYIEFMDRSVFDGAGRSRYQHVMLSDVRDVVFQGDPFARLDGGDIYYFLESGKTIGTCPVNARWMQLAFGPEVSRKAAASRVSCAGTLIGTAAGVMDYLLHMGRFILKAPPLARFSGVDQAIHNYIMFAGLVPNPRVVENGGAVLTVPENDTGALVVGPGGELHGPGGGISEVVHQYDRHPAAGAAVARRYTTGRSWPGRAAQLDEQRTGSVPGRC